MKYDAELARKILIATEEFTPDRKPWFKPEIEGYDGQNIGEHVRLLAESDLLDAKDCRNLDPESSADYRPMRLTMDGHKFLDVIRSETTWSKLKESAIKTTGDVGLSVLTALATKLVAG